MKKNIFLVLLAVSLVACQAKETKPHSDTLAKRPAVNYKLKHTPYGNQKYLDQANKVSQISPKDGNDKQDMVVKKVAKSSKVQDKNLNQNIKIIDDYNYDAPESKVKTGNSSQN